MFVYEVGINKEKYPRYINFEEQVWRKPLCAYLVTYGLTLLVLPLCLLKDISKMSISNIFAVISILFVIISVMIEAPYYFSNFRETYPDKEINWYRIDKAFNANFDIFKAIASLFYTFACHEAAIPVFVTLKNNISRRIRKVFSYSLVLELIAYLCMAITGFLTVPVDTPSIILFREKIRQTDFLMIFARTMMAISLTFSLPCMYNMTRLSLLSLIWDTHEVTTKR